MCLIYDANTASALMFSNSVRDNSYARVLSFGDIAVSIPYAPFQLPKCIRIVANTCGAARS